MQILPLEPFTGGGKIFQNIGGGADIFIPAGLVSRAGTACIGGRGSPGGFCSVFAEK